MIRALIEAIIYALNSFPSKNVISRPMSPAMLVEDRPKPGFSQKMINFGAYALFYKGTTKITTARATPAIALRNANKAGGYYFMSLHTGRRIHGYNSKELPID